MQLADCGEKGRRGVEKGGFVSSVWDGVDYSLDIVEEEICCMRIERNVGEIVV